MTVEITQAPDLLAQPGQITPPDLQTLINFRIQNALAATNVHTVGTIVAFYPDTQTADVSVNYVRTLINSPQENVNIPYPTLVGCPVLVLGGGHGALTFPIAAGDTCFVLFNDRDLDAWYASGQILPPNSARIHDLSDGVVLVGLRSKANALSRYDSSHTQLRHGTSNATLSDTAAALNQGTVTVSVEDKVKIAVGVNTLLTALDDLCAALISATITGSAFSAGTVTALTAAKAEIDAVLK